MEEHPDKQAWVVTWTTTVLANSRDSALDAARELFADGDADSVDAEVEA